MDPNREMATKQPASELPSAEERNNDNRGSRA
jgi:hypothetical protein